MGHSGGVLGQDVAGWVLCFPGSENTDPGHPSSCWGWSGWVGFVVSHSSRTERAMNGAHPAWARWGLAFPGPRKRGTGGTRGDAELGWLGFVLSHPCDKDKDVARMGHPRVVLGLERLGWICAFPPLRQRQRRRKNGAPEGRAGALAGFFAFDAALLG
jgi:hypothetical protein